MQTLAFKKHYHHRDFYPYDIGTTAKSKAAAVHKMSANVSILRDKRHSNGASI